MRDTRFAKLWAGETISMFGPKSKSESSVTRVTFGTIARSSRPSGATYFQSKLRSVQMSPVWCGEASTNSR